MLRLLVAAPLAFVAACIIPPGDRQQIEELIRDRETALARDDAGALYHLHDLDYRMLCSLAQFRTLPRTPAPIDAIRDLHIRGSRASATIAVATNGEREEELDFVKDSGRWYLYEDAEPCLRSAAVRDG
jgi:hypothetical protein